MRTMIDPWEDDQYCWEMSMDDRDDRDDASNLPDHQSEREFKEFLGVSESARGRPAVSQTDFHESVKSAQKRRAKGIEEKPSETDCVYWLYVEDLRRKHPKPTDRSGKWLVFCKPDEIDETWSKVKSAVAAGNLGRTAKCSTRKGFKGSDYVICVYTHDWKDEDSVQLIRQGLRDIGITKPIPYKTDADTLAGRYAATGAKGIAKYYE